MLLIVLCCCFVKQQSRASSLILLSNLSVNSISRGTATPVQGSGQVRGQSGTDGANVSTIDLKLLEFIGLNLNLCFDQSAPSICRGEMLSQVKWTQPHILSISPQKLLI